MYLSLNVSSTVCAEQKLEFLTVGLETGTTFFLFVTTLVVEARYRDTRSILSIRCSQAGDFFCCWPSIMMLHVIKRVEGQLLRSSKRFRSEA